MIQMGGGLRTMEAIQGVLKAGIDKVILGTIIVEEAGLAKSAFDMYKSQIMVALDVKDGQVAIHGWKDDSGFPLTEALHIVEKLGGQEVIFTDIGRDGAMEGINLNGIQDVMQQTSMKIYEIGRASCRERV